MFRYTLSIAIVLLLFADVPVVEPEAGAYAVFVQQAEHLADVAEAYRSGRVDTDSVRATVAKTRLAYKRTSWLVEFYFPTYAAKHFNGAPLLKASRSSTHSVVEPPVGLQVIDEVVHAPGADIAQLSILTHQLVNDARQLETEMRHRSYPAADLLSAARTEVIRITTLYLSGYDTPGSLNGIDESRAALTAMGEVLRKQPTLRDLTALQSVSEELDRAAVALSQAGDFDTFDRLGFQRNHVNPLFLSLELLRRQAALPAVAPFPSGVNPEARAIFSDDFLDPYTYTELREADDSPALRELGRQLFYDRSLSGRGDMSCASCHQPKLAFTDGHGSSHRNALTLMNAVYADRYFYDLRAFSLEQQAEHVIYDHGEFATDYATIVAKIRSDADYRAQFRKVLGRAVIDRSAFSKALASYVLSLRSFNADFDRYARGESEVLDPAAYEGYNLFMGRAGCGTCHFAPTFSGLLPPAYMENESEILGVLASPHRSPRVLDADRGRMAGGLQHENVWIYDRSFKTPTVRNVALTGPYFHHGTYGTLEEVIDFYDHGGGAGIGLTVRNQTLPPDSLHLTATEKSQIIAFLHSLTDLGGAAGAR